MNSVYKSDEGRKLILDYYNNLICQWPVPFEELLIQTRHGETHIIECGCNSAPAIILFHGSSSNSAMWMGDIVRYVEDFRILAVDLPGEPGKSSEKRLDLNGPGYTQWVEDIYNNLGIQKAFIMGISLGGWVALKFATSMPEMVEKLVLLCPSGIGTQRLSFVLRIIPLMFLGEWGLKRINKIVYGDLDLPSEVKEFGELIARYFKPITGKIPIFSDKELKHLNMPTLLIVGDKDPLLNSRQTYDRLEKNLENFKGYYLEDEGHVLVGYEDKIYPFIIAN